MKLSAKFLKPLAIAACVAAALSVNAHAAGKVRLNLAHNLSETHTVHVAIQRFADEVKEKTEGRVEIKIFPNAQLGSETECLEQLKSGILPMTKVSAPGLAAFYDAYHGFGLPYLFKDTADFYKVMDSQDMQDFFMSSDRKSTRLNSSHT